MKKTFSWLSLSALIFSVFVVSCSKRDAPVPTTVWTGPAALLDSIVYTSYGKNYVQRFDFNQDSGLAKYTRIFETGDSIADFLSYDNNQRNRLSQVSVSHTGRIGDVYKTRKCYYSSDGLLATMKSGSDSTSFVYNSNKQLIGRYSYYSDSIYDANILTWSGANLVKVKNTQYANGNPQMPIVHNYTYTYDNKRNAYSSTGFYGALGYDNTFTWMSANNVIEETITTATYTSSNKTTYQYNDKNYPVGFNSENNVVRYVYKK